MSESTIVADVRVTLSRGLVRLFRNNVGALWDSRGRLVTYGLCPGSSDLIGWRSIEITPAMVGRKVAVFVALEGKVPGKAATAEQASFGAAVKKAGGIFGVFHSVGEADAILRGEEE